MEVPGQWPTAEAPGFHLGEGTVHVWRVQLDSNDPERHVSVLSGSERERAAEFRFTSDRDRFVIAHAALRNLLSEYLGTSPDTISFEVGQHGKPAVYRPNQVAWPHFSLSHSVDLALIAVTGAGATGVDIERVRSLDYIDDIAAAYFAPTERDTLQHYEGPDRVRAFYTCWTRKEAVLKALGLGLSAGLDGFAVSIRPEETPRILRMPREWGNPDDWTVNHLEPAPGYVGAVAVRAPSLDVSTAAWAV